MAGYTLDQNSCDRRITGVRKIDKRWAGKLLEEVGGRECIEKTLMVRGLPCRG